MVIPIFRIFDLEKARSFYIDFLGFKIDWRHQYEEGMPLYFQVSLGDAVLHLSEHHGDAAPGSAIRIKMKELEKYHSYLSKKDCPYANPALEKTPWGTKELTVIDPFSNRITFFEELA